jgi:hypothetical protein
MYQEKNRYSKRILRFADDLLYNNLTAEDEANKEILKTEIEKSVDESLVFRLAFNTFKIEIREIKMLRLIEKLLHTVDKMHNLSPLQKARKVSKIYELKQKIIQINHNWKISDSFHLKKYKVLTLIDKMNVKEEYNSVANEEIYQQLINEVETAERTNSTWQLDKQLIIIKKKE